MPAPRLRGQANEGMRMAQEIDRSRFWAYAFVALAGLLAGMALGQLGAVREPGRSRVGWPAATPPQPRTQQP
jgi:hypothetical protein